MRLSASGRSRKNRRPGCAGSLASVGLPQYIADVFAGTRAGALRGAASTDSGDLPRLLGRPTASLADAVAGALKDLG